MKPHRRKHSVLAMARGRVQEVFGRPYARSAGGQYVARFVARELRKGNVVILKLVAGYPWFAAVAPDWEEFGK